MGFLDKVSGVGLAAGLLGLLALGIKSSIDDQKEKEQRWEEEEQKRKEEEKRRNTPFYFPPKLSQEAFNEIVFCIIKQIKKNIDIQINNSIVYGTVTSQSGLSSWKFSLDFNDYGSLTGKYWLTSENLDSLLPKHIAEKVQEEIKRII